MSLSQGPLSLTVPLLPSPGFYDNKNILNCDSYLGVIFFTVGATMVVYAILGYYYVFSSLINLVSSEFKDSKFVDILEKLIRIREDEEMSFNVRHCCCILFQFGNVLQCSNVTSSGALHVRTEDENGRGV